MTELAVTFGSAEEEVLQLLWQGAQARAVSATNMNEHSSRSHTIFQLIITPKAKLVDPASFAWPAEWSPTRRRCSSSQPARPAEGQRVLPRRRGKAFCRVWPFEPHPFVVWVASMLALQKRFPCLCVSSSSSLTAQNTVLPSCAQGSPGFADSSQVLKR